jgi:hypothetical protein
MNLQALQAAEHSAIRRQWDVGMIVQRIAKHEPRFCSTPTMRMARPRS